MRSNHSHCVIRGGREKPCNGFSLVELLVCIAIIAIISGVIVARYRSFNSTLLLRDLAYEIALSIREAQVLGISVQGASGTFSGVYGMHFTLGTTYILFRDKSFPLNYRYDAGEEISTYTIGDRKQVTGLCAGSNCTTVTSLDVLFQRPDPDAKFAVGISGGAATTATPASASVIVSTPPDTNARTVMVLPTGQIQVQ